MFATADGRVQVLNGQGPAPAAATIDHYTGLGLDIVPGTGPLAAAVPGAFDAWMLLLRDHGTRPLSEVLKYAIGYAESGHPAVERIGATVETVRRLFTTEWPSSAAVYLPGGQPPAAGALFTNPTLAATWRRVITESDAAGGSRENRIDAARRVWREGFIAEALAACAARPALDTSGRRNAGVLTGDDLASWSASYETPVTHDWNGWTVAKAGPWSQGPAFLQQLSLLPDGLGRGDLAYGSGGYVHALVEGAKLAFADREAWYGDAAPVPLDDLLSPAYAAERRWLVGGAASHELRPGRPGGREPRLPEYVLRALAGGADRPRPHTDAFAGAGEPTVGGDGATRGDTCHLDVVDRHGNMIAATPSGGWLQSNPVVPELGFPLGTRLQMTWLEPGLPNSLTPGRRPRTTLSPSLALRDGRPVMAFGTPGGDQQDQWSFHFFLGVALRPMVRAGLDLQGAIDAPNWHTDGFPSSFHPRDLSLGSLTVESRIGEHVVEELRHRGHRVTVADGWTEGRMCAVARDPETGVLSAAANPRAMQGYAVGR